MRRKEMRKFFFILFILFNFYLQFMHGLTNKSNTNRRGLKFGCEAVKNVEDQQNIFNYDCSHLDLDWSIFPGEKIFESVHYCTDLNLAFNSFDSIVRDRSFRQFIHLNSVLNMSSNAFSHLEEHALFYEDTNIYRPLAIQKLDLSNNSFEQLPWNALKCLEQLRYLSLKSNPIRHLDASETGLYGLDSGAAFLSLVELDLSDCQVETVDASVLLTFKRLQHLNLAGNRLRTLSYEVGVSLRNLASFSYLNVRSNPFVCDCKLIWLKMFLINNRKDNETTCLMNVTDTSASTSVNNDQSEQRLKPDNNNNKNDTIQNRQITISKSNKVFYEQRRLSILALEDEQFVCDLQLVNTERKNNCVSLNDHKEIVLKCHVNTYPKARIWWTYGGKRVLGKTILKTAKMNNSNENASKNSENNSDDIEIEDSIVKKNLSSSILHLYTHDIYGIESTLRIRNVHKMHQQEIACHAAHIFKNYKPRKFFGLAVGEHLILDPIFPAALSSSLTRPLLARKEIKFCVQLNKNLEDVVSRDNDSTPQNYWIIPTLCITLPVVLFVLFFIVRQMQKGEHTTSSSTAYDWRDASFGFKQRANVTLPLKPDVIRQHADFVSTYANPIWLQTPTSNFRYQTGPNRHVYSFDSELNY